MGEFRFRLPDYWEFESRHAKSVHVIGLDGTPWPCRVTADGNQLTVIRNRDESGKLYVTYPFKKYGEFTIATGTLAERREPFRIMVELARGTLNRLRNQISMWGEGGLKIPEEVHSNVATAIRWLGKAIMQKDDGQSDIDATKALELAFDGVFGLSEAFGDQISKVRLEHNGMPAFWTAHFEAADKDFKPNKATTEAISKFDLMQVAPWRKSSIGAAAPDVRTEDAETNWTKNTIVGPLLDASAGGLEKAVVDLDDFFARRDYLLNQCRAAIEKLPSSVSLVHVACGLNGMGHRHLSYPQQIEITTEMLTIIDDGPVDVPTMVSFDFPWAERLASAVGGIHPLRIADSLLRQGEQINFLGLDINLDYWPGGSVVRDPLQWVDMIDIWSQLNLPLVLCLRMPSGDFERVEASRDRLINEVRSNLDDSQRLRLLETVLPMLVARPAVHGVIWRQATDQDDPRFPGSGLIKSDGDAKEILDVITSSVTRKKS